MTKFINLFEFVRYLFDSDSVAKKVSMILKAVLEAQSPRISEIAQKMPGNADSNYKMIQRLLQNLDPKAALLRLFRIDALFVIGDPTEMPRPQAWKTDYVGTLKDGKTKGFWMLTLATPFRGRAIPFSFVTYSSKTIQQQADSRNLNHFRAFAQVKELIGEKPLVLDREFSYLELLLRLVEDGINFVIRLNLGSHPPAFFDQEGKPVGLTISPGEKVMYNKVFYKGQVYVNLMGSWKKGLDEPLWVMTNLEARRGLQIYLSRMKVDESFRDLKNLLHLDRLMNKRQDQMEKVVALVMLAFSIGLLVGEEVRDQQYGQPIQAGESVPEKERIEGKPTWKKGRKWKLYSGLFILLKQKLLLSAKHFRAIVRKVLTVFAALVYHPVRTYV